MFVIFIIYNTKHNPPEKYKIYHKNRVFLLLWGFKMQIKMSFMGLEILLFGYGKVLELFFKVLLVQAMGLYT